MTNIVWQSGPGSRFSVQGFWWWMDFVVQHYDFKSLVPDFPSVSCLQEIPMQLCRWNLSFAPVPLATKHPCCRNWSKMTPKSSYYSLQMQEAGPDSVLYSCPVTFDYFAVVSLVISMQDFADLISVFIVCPPGYRELKAPPGNVLGQQCAF